MGQFSPSVVFEPIREFVFMLNPVGSLAEIVTDLELYDNVFRIELILPFRPFAELFLEHLTLAIETTTPNYLLPKDCPFNYLGEVSLGNELIVAIPSGYKSIRRVDVLCTRLCD